MILAGLRRRGESQKRTLFFGADEPSCFDSAFNSFAGKDGCCMLGFFLNVGPDTDDDDDDDDDDADVLRSLRSGNPFRVAIYFT